MSYALTIATVIVVVFTVTAVVLTVGMLLAVARLIWNGIKNQQYEKRN